MATRFYLPSSGTAPSSPTIDSSVWEHINTDRRVMSVAKRNTAQTSTTYTPDGADDLVDKDAHFVQFVSFERLTAQTINAQTVKLTAICSEANANNNISLTWRVLLERAGSIVGTILAIRRDATECATTLTNRTDSATSSSLSCNDGDRLVLEIGLAGLPTATGGTQGHNGSIQLGDNQSTDLPENDTDTGATKNPWFEFAENLSFQVDNPPVAEQRSGSTLASIAATWAIVTAIPLFGAVLTNEIPVSQPIPAHPLRTIEQHAHVIQLAQPDPWPSQTRRKLVQPGIVASVDNPPFDAEQRSDLLAVLSYYQPPIAVPLWQGMQTIEGVVIGPVDNPPFGSRRAAQQAIDSQWLPRPLTQITSSLYAETADNPPFSTRENYRGEWPDLIWPVQTRPELVPITVAQANNPPGDNAAYILASILTQWEPLPLRVEWLAVQTQPIDAPPPMREPQPIQLPPTWDAQARPKLVQPAAGAAADNPPGNVREPMPIEPVIWDAQTRPKLPASVTAIPVNDPPFSSRDTITHEPLTWDAQTRPKLIQVSGAAAIDNPPFSARKFYRGEWNPSIWEAQSRPGLIQPSSVVVDNPPFGQHRRPDIALDSHWLPRDLTVMGVSLMTQGIDSPPFSARHNYAGEWPGLAWDAQVRPKLILTPDNPPFDAEWRGDLSVLRQTWEGLDWSAQRRPLVSPSALAVPVNDPVPFARRQYQYICATWKADEWPTQARGPVTADGTPLSFNVIHVKLHVAPELNRALHVAPELSERLHCARTISRQPEV